MFSVYYITDMQFITKHQKPNIWQVFIWFSQFTHSVADITILTAKIHWNTLSHIGQVIIKVSHCLYIIKSIEHLLHTSPLMKYVGFNFCQNILQCARFFLTTPMFSATEKYPCFQPVHMHRLFFEVPTTNRNFTFRLHLQTTKIHRAVAYPWFPWW